MDSEIRQGYFFRFNVDSILRSDLETRYNSYRTGITAGFLTPNEARGMEDLPSHENGDVLIANGSYVSLEDVGIAYSKYNKEEKNLRMLELVSNLKEEERIFLMDLLNEIKGGE